MVFRKGSRKLYSTREHRKVQEYEHQYEDGSDPRLLEIIDIPVLELQPAGCQKENWLLDPEYRKKVSSYSPLDLSALTDLVEALWIEGDSTYHGCNDGFRLIWKTGCNCSHL